jgi:hypothetical protein
MAHFAQIDADNIVLQVLVVPDEQEHRGQDFLANDLQLGGNWIQTSYNNRIRKQYAGIGMAYNAEGDVFIQVQPHPSWSLDGNYDWQPPIPKPEGANVYWDEERYGWFGYSPVPREFETRIAELGD